MSSLIPAMLFLSVQVWARSWVVTGLRRGAQWNAAPSTPQGPRALASCCLMRWSRPPRNPPRIVVVVGPSAVGRGPLLQRLVSEFPDKLGLTVSSTSRWPHAHEVDGR